MSIQRARGQAAEQPAGVESLVRAKARRENFRVASLALPRSVRSDLMTIYAFARMVDDAGDEATGDRLALLDRIEEDLTLIAAGGSPADPVMGRLGALMQRRRLPDQPCRRLIEANRQDQVVSRYQTYEELLGYCELSANPVGHLVLHVLDAATPERLALSDRVCTGLQLAEHWQDVAEDLGRGRVYLPIEDLARFGCGEGDLAAPRATPALRDLMAFQVARARDLLRDGAPLVATLRGRARVGVAGFVAGGVAALDAIARAGFDVLGGAPRPSRRRRARLTLRILLTGAIGDGR